MSTILPLEAGAIVNGHYRIVGLINTGGFGSVYRGLALSEGNRPCAIKETYDVTPAARRQALMEAAILFTVKSDHLPQVYDAFEENGRFYLVMQLIEGQNCSQLVRNHGMFNEQQVLGWLLPVADVLQELHSRNPPVLHRDIKPANIIVTPQSVAVLVDFGLTRLYDPGVETHTMARAVSEGFSPLEQYVGQTSPQSDMYSLAATMYFLLTAQVPPASVARSMQDGLIPPRQLNPQVSPRIENVLLRAMALHASQRFDSMLEFTRALRSPDYVSYTDQTISQSRYQGTQAATEVASHPSPQRSLPPVAPQGKAPGAKVQAQAARNQVQSHPQTSAHQSGRQQHVSSPSGGRQTSAPRPSAPGWNAQAPQAPNRRQPGHIPPPAGGVSAQQNYAPQRPVVIGPLPSPAGQGCLWGFLQGLISAIILLVWHKDTYFYIGIVEGLLFYLLAGFFTTRRGGSPTRGISAGAWAGSISLVTYWITMPVGLFIQASRMVEVSQEHHGDLSLQRALQLVKPAVLNTLPISDIRQNVSSLLVLAAIGLAIAMFMGLLGGILGSRVSRR